MTQMLLMRVGLDTGSGGSLAPRFDDGTFEYVPIPEKRELIPGRGVAFRDLPGRFGGTLDTYPKNRGSGFAHYDPEFNTFTYGEPTRTKRAQLLKLRAGDYLVFYAGLQGHGIAPGTTYIIGYFVVTGVHQPPAEEDWPPASLTHLHNNAHFRRANPEPDLVVVQGCTRQSMLLRHAIQLSDARPSRHVLPEIAEKIGYAGSTLRAVGHWVPDSHIRSAVAWLEAASASERAAEVGDGRTNTIRS